MKPALFLSAFAVLGLSGCVTGYGYSDDGYYYARPSASMGSYGSIGYGTGGWRSGYGMGYGYPGYYDPYSRYYYDPYYGYYFPRPPVVIVRPPPGHGHDDDDHDGDDHDGHRPPPWRDLDNLGDRTPKMVHAPDATGGSPRQLWQPPADRDSAPGSASRQPERVRMPDPAPPRANRIDSPRPGAAPPSMPRMDGGASAHKGDRRR